MAADKLKLGDRVRVIRDYFVKCLQGANGRVSQPPDEVKAHDARWRDYWREDEDSSGGIIKTYWIVFNEEILDPNCEDHPIDAGAISESDLNIPT